jgi:hypothetical protein
VRLLDQRVEAPIVCDVGAVETECVVIGGHADFIVRTDDSLYQDRILKMGWTPAGDGVYARRLDIAPDIDRIFHNFNSHLIEMLDQSARLTQVRWDEALAEFAMRARGTSLRWWVYGSAALAVCGLDVSPGDVDICVDDPHLAGAIMSDCLVEPVTRLEGWVADWGGRAFHGAIIEWISGTHPTGSKPPHEQEPDAANWLHEHVWQGMPIAVPDLTLSLAIAEKRGLTDRAQLIRRAVEAHNGAG